MQQIGLLFSGGLDSAILLQRLLQQGYRVQPIYVRAGLRWEESEFHAARAYLHALSSRQVEPLAAIFSPLAGLYEDHWSVAPAGNSANVPNFESPDSEVFLPGRNLMLVAPAGLWCQVRGLDRLAIGILDSNPFDDAATSYFQQLETLLCQSHASSIRLLQPLRETSKRELMQGGADLPLELTFSCLDPVEGMHCGMCNKCAERQRAFRESGLADRTIYGQLDTMS